MIFATRPGIGKSDVPTRFAVVFTGAETGSMEGVPARFNAHKDAATFAIYHIRNTEKIGNYPIAHVIDTWAEERV